MKIYDITRTAQTAPLYPGSEPLKIEAISAIGNGDLYNCSRITADSHIGTHADAFSHFLPDGLTIDQIPPERYIGACRVLSVPPATLLARDVFRGKVSGCTRLALRSGGGSYLSADAAHYLVERGIRTLLTDALSVAPPNNEAEIHRILLGASVALVENADLAQMRDGDYFLCALPVKYGGCDGAPVRAVLIEDWNKSNGRGKL